MPRYMTVQQLPKTKIRGKTLKLARNKMIYHNSMNFHRHLIRTKKTIEGHLYRAERKEWSAQKYRENILQEERQMMKISEKEKRKLFTATRNYRKFFR